MRSENTPIVSVVIPVKNRPELIREALYSLKAQSFLNWEALVIDDRSDDDTCNVVSALASKDARIRLMVRSGERGGAPVCRNIGSRAARGKYIVYLDSDDLLAEHCLERRVRVMEASTHLDFAVFNGGIFDNYPGDTDRIYNLNSKEDNLDRFLRFDLPWSITGPVYRRLAIGRIGDWDENLSGGQDVDYSMRAVALGLNHACFDSVDYYIRRSGKGRQRISSDKWGANQLWAYERRLDNIRHLMQAQDMLTVKRKVLIAGNLFFIAWRWIILGGKDNAFRVWAQCKEESLIKDFYYWMGLAFLRLRHTMLESIIAWYIFHHWPSDLIIRTRLESGRYRIGQQPGVYEVPLMDPQHPFRPYARIIMGGPTRVALEYVRRRAEVTLQLVKDRAMRPWRLLANLLLRQP